MIDRLQKTHAALESGLKEWVRVYILMRHLGRIAKAIRLRDAIRKKIKKDNLDPDTVWFYWGDPDKPGFVLPSPQ